MTPELILATIKSGFDFGTELLRFLQTAQGQEIVKTSLNDRKVWDGFWNDVGGGIRKLFNGELMK